MTDILKLPETFGEVPNFIEQIYSGVAVGMVPEDLAKEVIEQLMADIHHTVIAAALDGEMEGDGSVMVRNGHSPVVEAAKVNNLDNALRVVMSAWGIEDGMVASHFFINLDPETWRYRMSIFGRERQLYEWLGLELIASGDYDKYIEGN